jgi:Protein of unknown function (DUF2934)
MVRKTGSPAFIVVSAHDIAKRAYDIYLERGRTDGFANEDWLRAERELKAAMPIAPKRASMNAAKAKKRENGSSDAAPLDGRGSRRYK